MTNYRVFIKLDYPGTKYFLI